MYQLFLLTYLVCASRDLPRQPYYDSHGYRDGSEWRERHKAMVDQANMFALRNGHRNALQHHVRNELPTFKLKLEIVRYVLSWDDQNRCTIYSSKWI